MLINPDRGSIDEEVEGVVMEEYVHQPRRINL